VETVTETTTLEVRPVAGLLGAELVDLDLSQPLDDAIVGEIHSALARYGVVFITGQHIGPEEHRTFARSLGELKLPPDYLENLADVGCPEISVISTDNQLAYTSDRWHSDVTWATEPPRYSVLHMQQMPAIGGDTMWLSQCAAYDTLSPSMQTFLESLTAHHELPTMPERAADHPVVIRHPITGRRALFVNSVFTSRINELDAEESTAMLQFLLTRTQRPELSCRWHWSNGDVGVWDNHFVQHYALYDYGTASRRIHRIEIQGHAPVPAVATAS
jgi:taurine dioxygenase